MTGDGAVFGWATVVSVNPLSVRRDGETAPLGVSPFSLVDTSRLAVGDRVWIQLVDRRALILGVGGGPRLPYRIASGRVSITPSAADTPTSLVVTFPTGRFTEAPMVIPGMGSSVAGTTAKGVGVTAISTTSCRLWFTRSNLTTTSIYWIAVQT